MKGKQLLFFTGLINLILSTCAFAAPHFYIQMENRSNKEAAISFQQDVGNVYLEPTLSEHTNLNSHAKSEKYAVNIEPLDPNDTFNVIFTGKHDCTFNIGFYGPGNPKVKVVGPGCLGGGYEIVDRGTLLLYIADIDKKS